MLDIRFTPFSPEEKYEAAKAEVANLLDSPDWHWLKARIADEWLCWIEIFELVAAAS